MRNLAIGIVAIIILFFGIVVYRNENKPTLENGKPIIKIGVSLPLSGDLVESGAASLTAIQMAMKELPPDTKYDYKLVVEDDTFTPMGGARVANKLINIDKVNAIVSLWALAGAVISERAQKNKIVNVTCAAGAEIGKPYYVFNNFTQDDTIYEVTKQHLRKQGARKIAYVMTLSSGTADRAAFMEKALKADGFDIVAMEQYMPDTRDFRISILKLEQKNPDYYISDVILPGTILFLKQFRELTNKKNVLGMNSFHVIPREHEALREGMYSVRASVGTDEFAERFRQKTGREIQLCAANTYDNIHLLIWGFENAPVRPGQTIPDNADVVETILKKGSGSGAMGEYVIGADGLIRTGADLYKLSNGSLIRVEE